MGRAPCCDKANVKKGPWSPEEDAKLKHFIQTNGTGGNWITLPSKAGLKRCGKSCRLRWINYLRPDIKHGSFTEEEEKTIIDFHGKVGSRWSLIAAQLPGRTDNDIKNYWNTRLKKKLAEKGNTSPVGHQEQRTYMRSAPVPLFQAGRLLRDAAMRQNQMNSDLLMEQASARYVEQQRQRNYASVQSAVSAALFQQGQHLDQWQLQKQEPLLAVKNEFSNDQLPSDLTAVLNDTQRASSFAMSEQEIKVRKLESELLNDLVPQVVPELSNAYQSNLILNQSVDGMHHQSPNSDCSNWSSDRSFERQLDDSSYSENFSSICNSYADPPPLVDAHKYLLASQRCGAQLEESPFGDNFSIGNSFGDPSALLDSTQRAIFSNPRYNPAPWEISAGCFV